jgi:hypothetical protein
MERRDVLKALLALPAVKNVAVADIKPNDIIVLEADTLTLEQVEMIRKQAAIVWPGRKVLVLSGGLRMKIAREMA